MPYRFHTEEPKLAFARWLRATPTPGEERLWEQLRARRLDGWRWRRQAPILGWIVDFYCPAARLAIEVDGASHRDRKRQDAHRDRALRRHGITTLRFSEERCQAIPEAVSAEIAQALRTYAPTLSPPA